MKLGLNLSMVELKPNSLVVIPVETHIIARKNVQSAHFLAINENSSLLFGAKDNNGGNLCRDNITESFRKDIPTNAQGVFVRPHKELYKHPIFVLGVLGLPPPLAKLQRLEKLFTLGCCSSQVSPEFDFKTGIQDFARNMEIIHIKIGITHEKE
jgi:hypothetical protein